jgi:hypothetical protein
MKRADYNTTRDLLLQTELPQQTRTYKPISHQQLMDLTLESIGQAGFTLDKEIYSGGNNGNVATGRYTISNVMDAEMQLQIGWQNSYDKTVSLKFAIGTRIMICQNGCVSGDYGAFKKKHMGAVQEFTPGAITEYIKQAGEAFKKMQEERDAMKQIEVTKRQKAEFIGRLMLEEQIISSSQVNSIAREFDNPTFDYGAPGSLWELYQFTTQSMRETHPGMWMSDHIKAHSFFVNAAGILVSPIVTAEQIMAISGDTEEEIEQFRQLSMEF